MCAKLSDMDDDTLKRMVECYAAQNTEKVQTQ